MPKQTQNKANCQCLRPVRFAAAPCNPTRCVIVFVRSLADGVLHPGHPCSTAKVSSLPGQRRAVEDGLGIDQEGDEVREPMHPKVNRKGC